jgi:hypothetical protein
MSGNDLVLFYKNLGYTGLFISDHFFNGNTTVPRDLPWNERIELFYKGYEAAFSAGKEHGLDVFFAWEYTYMGSDFLTYGLDKQWLLDHPDCDKISPGEYFDAAHADGAFIVHAHPFRMAGYISCMSLFPDKVDGVEVINSSMTDEVNERGEWYAETYNLLKLVGSDTHFTNKNYLSAMIFDTQLDSPRKFIELVKNKKYSTKNITLE